MGNARPQVRSVSRPLVGKWGGGEAAPPAVLPFSGVAVRADGWTLDATIGASKDGGSYVGLNDFDAPGIELTVTSKSWNTSGVETTTTRTVIATAVLRNPYPDQATLEETEDGSDLDVIFTLSDYIYADDTVTCSIAEGFFTDDGSGGSALENSAQTPTVTNNSAEAYPQPQAVWLHHDLMHIKASSFSPKLAVNHKFGRNGQPVRAVKFIVTDESAHSVEAIATTLSTESYAASSLYSNFFTASIDLTTLDQSELLTIDAIIYPWVGDSYQISVSGETYPSPNLTVLKALNDKGSTFGTVYAYVDGVGGSPAVSTNPATAAGTPYASISAAAAAIQTYNNSNFSRNNTAGGIIRIPAATTITGLGADTMDTALTDGVVPLVLEGVDRATSKYISEATSANNDIPGIFKVRNLTLQKVSGSIIMFDGENLAANMIAFEDCTFDLNGNALYAGWMIQCGRMYFLNCDGADCGQGYNFSTNLGGTALALGCSFIPQQAFNAVSSRSAIRVGPSNATHPLAAHKGIFYGWNVVSNNASNVQCFHSQGQDLGPRGLALVGNVLEKYHTTGSPNALFVSADGDVTPVENIVIAANTVVGERSNVLYQDTGTATVAKKGVVLHNVMAERNIKSDVFGTNGNLVGNWAFRYGAGCSHNASIYGSNSTPDTPGASEWLSEIAWRGDVAGADASPVVVDWVDDNSADGGGGGGGDYTPGVSTAIPQIPAGETCFAVDLFGTAIPTDGTAYAGAVQ